MREVEWITPGSDESGRSGQSDCCYGTLLSANYRFLLQKLGAVAQEWLDHR